MAQSRIVVIGAGVCGLTSAVRLLEAGADVLIRTAAASMGTVSAVAGAMIGPSFGPVDEMTAALIEASDRYFRSLASDPSTGVRIRRGRLLSHRSTRDRRGWCAPSTANIRELTPEELPQGFDAGMAVELPFVDMPVFLGWLTARIGALGGRIEQQPVSSLFEISRDHADVVVNCSGLAARTLADDPSVTPVRGQHVIVDAPWQQDFVYEHSEREWVSVMPHGRRVILGGVAEHGSYSLVPDPGVTAAILERCKAVVPELAKASVIGVEVGLRPFRPRVRLERTGSIVHNYGHGGNGVMLSWGCADAVTALAIG